MIGASVRRNEDRPLLMGRGAFAADIVLPGQVYLRIVRSPFAHGVIRSVDVEEARALPGVVGAWSATDVDLPVIDFRQVSYPELLPYRQPVLARDRVRYVGEPIAVIAAIDRYIAEDAEELVVLDIEELPAHLDGTAAPAQWSAVEDSAALDFTWSYGDVDREMEAGARIVEVSAQIGRHSGVPMECRGVVASFDPSTGCLDVRGAAKVPHYNRNALAAMLGLAPSQVTLHETHVGGGFGIRGELYPEDVLACWVSRELGRPVSWIEDRREHFVSANHSRDQVHRLRAAITEEGEILALEDEFWLDQGAYVRTHAATVPTLTASMLPGPYRIPAYRVTGHVRLTNKTPAGTYRAPGRYEGTFARERLIDAIAAELGVDANVIRRRNFIPPSSMPFARPLQALGTRVEYDSGDYALLLDRCEHEWDLVAVEKEVAERRSRGELVGLGRAFFVEKSGLGPFEGVRVTVDESGRITATTGGSSVGQGFETVIAQVCTEVLGGSTEDVTVLRRGTVDMDYGMGAFASRLTVMAGSAAHLAATAVRDKAIATFAALHEVDPADVELHDGRVSVVGSPETAASLGEVAVALRPPSAHRLGVDPGLTAEEWFYTDHMNYPYGYHVALVSVDPDVYDPRVERYWIGYDVGRSVNPQLVHGQIHGGAAQGLGGALLEEFRYDSSGQPLCTSFLDYLMPTAREVPVLDVLVTEDAPSPLNPLGVKGAGEGGTTAFGAAVACAVDQALGGYRVASIPVGPAAIREWLIEGGT
jgi:carbon-monoxide dehydrogenase large subunit